MLAPIFLIFIVVKQVFLILKKPSDFVFCPS